MRLALAKAKSIGTCSPSGQPWASATGWLPVAKALAPARMTACALPTSQMLYRTTGLPGTCSAAKVSNLPIRATYARPGCDCQSPRPQLRRGDALFSPHAAGRSRHPRLGPGPDRSAAAGTAVAWGQRTVGRGAERSLDHPVRSGWLRHDAV